MARTDDVQQQLTTAERLRTGHGLTDADTARILGEGVLREQYWMGLADKLGLELDRMEGAVKTLQEQNRKLREQVAAAKREQIHEVETPTAEGPAAATG